MITSGYLTLDWRHSFENLILYDWKSIGHHLSSLHNLDSLAFFIQSDISEDASSDVSGRLKDLISTAMTRIASKLRVVWKKRSESPTNRGKHILYHLRTHLTSI